MEQLFFELIRVAIGTQNTLSRPPSKNEWAELYTMAKKQSLVGICFAAVQKLQCNDNQELRTQNPQSEPTQNQEPRTQNLDEVQYLTWMGMAAKIQQRNHIVDKQCVVLQKRLSAEGFRTSVLKGQGVGQQYAEHLRGLRQSGDIDIWMDGGFERVNEWIQKVAPTKVVNQHHVALDVFDATEVEAHYHPINMTNPWRQKRLKAFIKAHEDECLSTVNDGKIHAPTTEFNLVFLMVHIFHHLFTEGVGLRQLMDYYFVLLNARTNSSRGFNGSEVQMVISDLGLDKFSTALMWVMKEVFGLSEQLMICEANNKDGLFLLDEIMQSGNFGKHDERQKGLYDSKWNSFWMVNGKTFRFWRFDHWAWLWSPIERVKGYAWRRMHGYRQY